MTITDNSKDRICPFSVTYKSVIFYSASPKQVHTRADDRREEERGRMVELDEEREE
jgi:hypothetical protein